MSPRLTRLGRCLPPTLDAKGKTGAPAPQTRISQVRRREIAATALVIWFLLGAIVAPQVHAQTFTVFYSFTGYPENGVSPFGGLVIDRAGNLYGVTQAGGSPPPFDGGTVFKLDPSGNESVLHGFTGGDGSIPYAGLVIDTAGNLYGTTLFGGSSGYGTVFKLEPSGTETVLHSFTNAAGDGAYPFAGLLLDTVGNLYGTTEVGGSFGYGTVFKLDPSGTETVLYSFTNAGGDGAYPLAGLVMDTVGDLYGTTDDGGSSGYGTVFKLDSSGTETVLHSFTNSSGGDGAYPFAGLVMDTAGNLYGTTVQGGSSNYGTVFKLDPAGSETVLHSFAYSDGAAPIAGLVMDTAGNLYGTAHGGGGSGYGTVFKLDSSGTETVLHSFTNSSGDGGDPEGGLIMDMAGNLYGTTFEGGSSDYGTVFKLTLPVTYTSLINLVKLFVTKPRVAANLVATLERAQVAAAVDNKKAADHQLHTFIKQVSARSGKSLTTAQAAILIQQAKALTI